MYSAKFIRKTTICFLILLMGCSQDQPLVDLGPVINHEALLMQADKYLLEAPITITAFPAERSAGGLHDYFSEGSYWWPDPEHPEGPYIRRDGYRNPDNFIGHITAMKNLQEAVTTLVAAYKISGDEKYARHAIAHLRAWFVDAKTKMNPSLKFAQAIHGRVTGRGIGIIDTVKLIEVALAAWELERLGILEGTDLDEIKWWFEAYADWLNTSPFGIDERDHGNNHSTWWAAQVAAFARFTDRDDLLQICQDRFKLLLSVQMAEDGSFPKELARTKPYAYMLYNLDAFAVLARLGSTEKENLWRYETTNGNLRKTVDFMTPFLINIDNWPKEPDVTGFEKFPHRRDYILFAAQAYRDIELYNLWKTLPKGNTSDWHLLVWLDKIK